MARTQRFRPRPNLKDSWPAGAWTSVPRRPPVASFASPALFSCSRGDTACKAERPRSRVVLPRRNPHSISGEGGAAGCPCARLRRGTREERGRHQWPRGASCNIGRTVRTAAWLSEGRPGFGRPVPSARLTSSSSSGAVSRPREAGHKPAGCPWQEARIRSGRSTPPYLWATRKATALVKKTSAQKLGNDPRSGRRSLKPGVGHRTAVAAKVDNGAAPGVGRIRSRLPFSG